MRYRCLALAAIVLAGSRLSLTSCSPFTYCLANSFAECSLNALNAAASIVRSLSDLTAPRLPLAERAWSIALPSITSPLFEGIEKLIKEFLSCDVSLDLYAFTLREACALTWPWNECS